MKPFLSGVVQLALLTVLVGALATIAAVADLVLSDANAHRAFSLAFYVAGGVLLVLAFFGFGGNRSAVPPGTRFVLGRLSIPESERVQLTARGGFAIVAAAMLAVGVTLDFLLR